MLNALTSFELVTPVEGGPASRRRPSCPEAMSASHQGSPRLPICPVLDDPSRDDAGASPGTMPQFGWSVRGAAVVLEEPNYVVRC
jgi:hypothetical protein